MKNTLRNCMLGSRVAESKVKYPTPTPDSNLSKISDSDSRLLNIMEMKFG